MKLPKFLRRNDVEAKITSEKFPIFIKLLESANDTIINKPRKGTLRVTYFKGQELKRSLIIQLKRGFISFREDDELYQLKYFGLKKSEDEIFDINKFTFDKHWNLGFSNNVELIKKFANDLVSK